MNRRNFLLSSLSALMVSACQRAGVASPPMNTESKTVTIRLFDAQGHLTEAKTVQKVVKTDAEWKKQLSGEAYQVARGKGTERAFCGVFYDNHKKGYYSCVCCELPLFRSDAKFESGTGWPSFFQPVCRENITEITDSNFGMSRTEILCTQCDGHLGHVFDDGPAPTGLRYCLNSVSLTFTETK